MNFLPDDELLQKILAPMEPVLKTFHKLNPEEKEAFYAAAYGFYQTGDYEKSEQFFTHLVLNDPFDKRFWKGVASSRQMQKKYQEALHSWSVLCLFDPKNPLPHFHAAECLLSLNQYEEAEKALNCSERLIDETHLLKEKIIDLKNLCRDHLQ